jgi:hypothetical protein
MGTCGLVRVPIAELLSHAVLSPAATSLDMQTTTQQLILLDARYHSNSAAIAVGRSVLRTVYLPVFSPEQSA